MRYKYSIGIILPLIVLIILFVLRYDAFTIVRGSDPYVHLERAYEIILHGIKGIFWNYEFCALEGGRPALYPPLMAILIAVLWKLFSLKFAYASFMMLMLLSFFIGGVALSQHLGGNFCALLTFGFLMFLPPHLWYFTLPVPSTLFLGFAFLSLTFYLKKRISFSILFAILMLYTHPAGLVILLIFMIFSIIHPFKPQNFFYGILALICYLPWLIPLYLYRDYWHLQEFDHHFFSIPGVMATRFFLLSIFSFISAIYLLRIKYRDIKPLLIMAIALAFYCSYSQHIHLAQFLFIPFAILICVALVQISEKLSRRIKIILVSIIILLILFPYRPLMVRKWDLTTIAGQLHSMHFTNRQAISFTPYDEAAKFLRERCYYREIIDIEAGKDVISALIFLAGIRSSGGGLTEHKPCPIGNSARVRVILQGNKFDFYFKNY